MSNQPFHPLSDRPAKRLQSQADITVESGQYDPETLLDLAISNLALVTDRQPALNKASTLLAKVCRFTRGR